MPGLTQGVVGCDLLAGFESCVNLILCNKNVLVFHENK